MSRRTRRRRVRPVADGRTRRAGLAPRSRIRVGDPSDVLAIVPYLVGFHPQESLVVLLVAGGEVILTARMDLPDVAAGPDAEIGAELASYWSGLAAQHRAERLVAIGYSGDRDRAVGLLGELVDQMPNQAFAEVLYVDGERWWSLTCDGSCCPPEGTPYALDSHRVSAEAVLAGLGVAADRSVLEGLVQGPAAAEVAELSRLVEEVTRDEREVLRDRPRALRAMEQAVEQALASPELTDRACARLAVLSSDITVRDRAWAMITHEDASEHERVWSRVVARVPPVVGAAPLGLMGVAAWIGGNGALQNCCGARLVDQYPDYSLGHLLLNLSARAIPPSFWTEWAADLRADLINGSVAGSWAR